MRLPIAAAGLAALVAGTVAHAYDREDWPTHYAFGDGTDLGLTAAYRYDRDDFSGDRLPNGNDAFEDASTNRRKEFGVTLKKKGVYDAVAAYDFQAKGWLDAFLRVQSKAIVGTDVGAFRIGFSKTPVAFEGVTGTRADSFMELALPVQAIFESRRTGIDWAFERPQYIVNLGYYAGQDLQGDNDGTTIAGRVAWTPLKAEGNVLHLGVSASEESPDSTRDGRDILHQPSGRLRSIPEAGLTTVRLIDTGALANVDHIDRGGVEGLWIGGPWSVQGEYLREKIARKSNAADFTGEGWYVFGSWVLTGESRPYTNGNVGNIKPRGEWGAVELLLRYSELDLNDAAIHGGRQHDWTLGANWYLTTHFKFQANYVRAYSEKGALSLDPRILEVRAQIMF